MLFIRKVFFLAIFIFVCFDCSFSCLTLRCVSNLWFGMLSFYEFTCNLMKYLILRHSLNENYLNPLWHNFHFPVSWWTEYRHLSKQVWTTLLYITQNYYIRDLLELPYYDRISLQVRWRSSEYLTLRLTCQRV